MRKTPILAILTLTLAVSFVHAQDQESASEPETASQPEAVTEDPVHEELRALRRGILDAYEAKDIEKLITYLHPDVVVTYQNGDVSRGHDGVREFHRRMMDGPDRAVQNVETVFNVDELSIIYGDDTAVAFGDMEDKFALTGGLNFDLNSRWTATLVKLDDRWLVAALHASTDMFDNGVLDALLKANSLKAGGIGLALGLIVGFIVPRLVTKRKLPAN